MVCGQCVAGPHPNAVTDHGEPLMPERDHQRHHVARERACVVPAQGFVGEPDATRIDRDDLVVLCQSGHEKTPCIPRLRPPGHKQQRRSVAAGDSVQMKLAGVDQSGW